MNKIRKGGGIIFLKYPYSPLSEGVQFGWDQQPALHPVHGRRLLVQRLQRQRQEGARQVGTRNTYTRNKCIVYSYIMSIVVLGIGHCLKRTILFVQWLMSTLDITNRTYWDYGHWTIKYLQGNLGWAFLVSSLAVFISTYTPPPASISSNL